MAFKDLQIEIDAASEDVLAQEPLRLRLRQRFLQILPFFVILMIHIDEGRLGLHRVGAIRQPSIS